MRTARCTELGLRKNSGKTSFNTQRGRVGPTPNTPKPAPEHSLTGVSRGCPHQNTAPTRRPRTPLCVWLHYNRPPPPPREHEPRGSGRREMVRLLSERRVFFLPWSPLIRDHLFGLPGAAWSPVERCCLWQWVTRSTRPYWKPPGRRPPSGRPPGGLAYMGAHPAQGPRLRVCEINHPPTRPKWAPYGLLHPLGYIIRIYL
jgi:hypothetical protein